MSKLWIETLDEGARVNVSVSGECDAYEKTRFGMPRPSSRPPPPPSRDEDIVTVRRLPKPPRLPRR